MPARNIPQRIAAIKAEKARQGLTNQEITTRALDMGEYTSLTSVRRVFAEGSEQESFRDATLRPIEKVLGITAEGSKPAAPEHPDAFLQQIIRELNAQVKVLRRAHMWKNIALIFLSLVLTALLVADRLNPHVGWYDGGPSWVWSAAAGLLAGFALAVVIYNVAQYRKNKKAEQAAADVPNWAPDEK